MHEMTPLTMAPSPKQVNRPNRGGLTWICPNSATNDDATYPTPAGLIPGGGSILAAIIEASGSKPLIGGKPHEPMASLVRQRLDLDDLTSAWMVGDRASTDGMFARQVGCRFAQVLTGVASDASASKSADIVVPDLATFARSIINSTI